LWSTGHGSHVNQSDKSYTGQHGKDKTLNARTIDYQFYPLDTKYKTLLLLFYILIILPFLFEFQHALLLPVLVHHVRYHLSLKAFDEKIGYVFKDRALLQVRYLW
jgi:hypothetical protein